MFAEIIMCAALSSVTQAPIRVTLSKQGAAWQLERGGKPYFIKGAGGLHDLAQLSKLGGNSVRIWGAEEAGKVLDEAEKQGLTVLLGIWLGHKDQGFNYQDPKQVADQYNKAREVILKYRNHPALLAWGIGNEMEGYDKGNDPKIWGAVEAIAKTAKELDPNHPTMTVIAEVGGEKLPSIEKYCPHVDIVGVNSYGGAPSLGDRYTAQKTTKPYVVTEFGPLGQWETGKTPWNAPIEANSSEKAAHYRESYKAAVTDRKGLCLGSYAFNWGNKNEATTTWFGMFLPDNSKLESVDVMSELWTGKKPQWPSPQVKSLTLEGPNTVAPGAILSAKLDIVGEDLTVEWVLRDEASVLGSGGSFEPTPRPHPEAIVKATNAEVTIKVPEKPGAYRLYATIRNKHNGAATANVTFQAK